MYICHREPWALRPIALFNRKNEMVKYDFYDYRYAWKSKIIVPIMLNASMKSKKGCKVSSYAKLTKTRRSKNRRTKNVIDLIISSEWPWNFSVSLISNTESTSPQSLTPERIGNSPSRGKSTPRAKLAHGRTRTGFPVGRRAGPDRSDIPLIYMGHLLDLIRLIKAMIHLLLLSMPAESIGAIR